MSGLAETTAEFERALAERGRPRFGLRLFVAGMGARSTQAIADVKRLCTRFDLEPGALEIVDIYERPAEAAAAQIVAVPTLVRDGPRPQPKFIGSLADLEAIARGFGLVARRPLSAP